MSKILGKNVLVYFLLPESPPQFQPAGCSRNCVLTTNTVIAPVSTVGSGIWSEFKGLSMNWTISIDGLATFDENLGLVELRAKQFSLQTVYVTFQEYINSSRQINYSGYAVIQSVASTGSYTDVETYSIQLQGTGQLYVADGIIYGNPPTGFEITAVHPNTPGPGEVTLDFAWIEAVPPPENYRLEALDTTIDFLSGWDGSGTTTSLQLNDAHSYEFRIKSAYFSYQAFSEYSPTVLTWP